MNTQSLFYYAKRIQQLGFSGTWQAFDKRIKARNFRKFWREKALAHHANHTWEQISAQNNLPSFPIFFEKLKQHNFVQKILDDPEFQSLLPDDYKDPEIIKRNAEQATQNCFDILGSGNTCFTQIPWHADFKLPLEQSPTSWKSSFYQDIQIGAKQSGYSPDVKTPWELSRFQHIYFLGMANQSNTFVHHVDDWIDQNPYLLGINWKCPMDVAIRAINLIWGFYFFAHDQTILESFWQKLICSLYDHLHYLENNWETSDKPNNHYLADLLGHSYLSLFFINIKKTYRTHDATIANFMQQIDHQIHPDGASHEGSTKYHVLVIEMVLHFKLLCATNGVELPATFHNKFALMKNFIRDCTDHGNNLVMIGDDDSGKIVAGIQIAPSQKISHTTYQNFGISIIHDPSWHITFRHPTYQQHQPSGHFHQDQLSITLSINGIPILIDPGSYLYTANAQWRNTLRSATSHNTFYLEQYYHNNRQLEQQDLFQLARKEHRTSPIMHHDSQLISLQDYHTEYEYLGLTAHRKLTFDRKNKMLLIEDWFEEQDQTKALAHTNSWVLLFAPEIDLIQKKDKEWIIKKEKNTLGKLSTSLDFICHDGYFAPTYGRLDKTIKLYASQKLSEGKQFILFERKN